MNTFNKKKLQGISLFILLTLSASVRGVDYVIREITNNGQNSYPLATPTQFKFVVTSNPEADQDLIFTLRTENVESDLYIRQNTENFNDEDYYLACETQGNEYCVVPQGEFALGDTFYVEPRCRNPDKSNTSCNIFLQVRLGDARLIAFEEVFFSKETLKVDVKVNNVYNYKIQVDEGDIISLQVDTQKIKTVVALNQKAKYPSEVNNKIAVRTDDTETIIYDSNLQDNCRFWRTHNWDEQNSYQCYIYFSFQTIPQRLEKDEKIVSFSVIVKKKKNMIELNSSDNPHSSMIGKANQTYFYSYLHAVDSSKVAFTDLLLYINCNFESLRFYAQIIPAPPQQTFDAEKLNWKFPTNTTDALAVSYLLNANTSLTVPKIELDKRCADQDCVILFTAVKEGKTSQYWQQLTLSLIYNVPPKIVNQTVKTEILYSNSIKYYVLPSDVIVGMSQNETDIRVSVYPTIASAEYEISVQRGEDSHPLGNYSTANKMANGSKSVVISNPAKDNYVIALFGRNMDFFYSIQIQTGVFPPPKPDDSGKSSGSAPASSTNDPRVETNDDWIIVVFGIIMPIFLCLFLLLCLYRKHTLRNAKEQKIINDMKAPANYTDYSQQSGYKPIIEESL